MATALALLLFIVSASWIAAEAGVIGISPGIISFTRVLQGGYAETYITISIEDRGNSTVQTRIFSDDNLSHWFAFNDGSPIIVSDGNNRIKLTVQPPVDARPGNYSARVTFLIESTDSAVQGSTGSLVLPAIELRTNVEVTGEEFFSCTASAFSISSAELNERSDVTLRILNNGNVRINPRISVVIYDQWEQRELKSFDFRTGDILPTVEYVFSTNILTDLPIAQYWAVISVPECFSSGKTDFSILERGAIEDKGEFVRIRNPPWVFEKDFVQIEALFSNTGTTSVDAKFTGVIRLDNRIVAPLESQTITVPPGTTQSLDMIYQPQDPGRYVISGKVLYNRKITSEKESILNVRPATSMQASPLAVALIIVAYVIVIMAGIYLIILFRKKRKAGNL